MRLLQTVGPVLKPIDVADLKVHTVVTDAADDVYLDELIDVAREQVEADTGRALVEQTWQLVGGQFPAEISVPKPPLVSVTFIKYFDTSGVQQTLPVEDYQVLVTSIGASICPAPGKSWPAVQAGRYNAVVVEFVAGYVVDDGQGGTTGAIPARARQALMVWAAHLYENREHMSTLRQQELPSYQRLISGLEVGLL